MADTQSVKDKLAGKAADEPEQQELPEGANDPAERPTENAPAKRDANPLVPLIERMKPEIARVLPNRMDPDRLARIATTVARKTPNLMKCTPESFLGALMTCAQLGLEPGPLDHAYLIPFRNNDSGRYETQLIIGYKGLIDLARRSGHIQSIIAREVYANDAFEVEYGLEDRLEHRPLVTGDRGDVVCYYAVAKFVGGGHAFIVMSKDDVNKYREKSKAKTSGPWRTDYDAMAKKTCVRRLSTFLPMSVEMATAVAQDEHVRNVSDADDVELPVDSADSDSDPDVVDAEIVDQ